MASYGLRSPPLGSEGLPARPSYDTETLKAYIKKLLSTTLQNAVFPNPREKERSKAWCKEIGERVKQKMIGARASFIKLLGWLIFVAEVQPRGL